MGCSEGGISHCVGLIQIPGPFGSSGKIGGAAGMQYTLHGKAMQFHIIQHGQSEK